MHLTQLLVRGILGLGSSGSSSASSTASNGCPYEPTLFELEPLFSTWTFYKLNKYVSGACALFATLSIWTLQILHATHYSRPNEQVKIIRLAHLVPAYSMISWFCILVPQAYYYLEPWLVFVESVALVSFFLLLCEFIGPGEDQRTIFFTIIDLKQGRKDKKAPSGRAADTPKKRMKWYRRKWVAIFQFPIIAIFVAVVTDVTVATGDYCGTSLMPKFAHLWMFLLQNLSVGVAVTAILMMYAALKGQLRHHKPLMKLLALKLVVFLSFIQGIIFDILQSTKVTKPTSKLTWADVKIGIPTLIICIEMALISVFFHYAYSPREYMLGYEVMPGSDSQVAPRQPASAYKGGVLGWRALLHALDPREALFGFWYAFQMAGELRKEAPTK